MGLVRMYRVWTAATLLTLAACGSTQGSSGVAPAKDAQTIQDSAPDATSNAGADVAPDLAPDVPDQPDVPAVANDVSTLPIVPSDNGTFAARFLRTPEPPTPSGDVLEMLLMDTTGALLPGATVKATPWMPAMGHGSPKTPVVKDDGGGHYTISNLLFTMLGKWELRIDVTADAGQDRFTLVYQIK